MLACLVHRTQAFHFTLTKQLGLIQIALSKVFRSSDEIHQTFLHVHTYFMNVIEITLRNRKDFLTVTTYAIEMTITASFAFPSEILVTFQPMDIVVGFHPSLVGIRKDIYWFGFTNFGNPYLISILFTIHLLDEQLIAGRNKFHARNVIVARIARYVYPCSNTTIR